LCAPRGARTRPDLRGDTGGCADRIGARRRGRQALIRAPCGAETEATIVTAAPHETGLLVEVAVYRCGCIRRQPVYIDDAAEYAAAVMADRRPEADAGGSANDG
jgi:hypothetical protein